MAFKSKDEIFGDDAGFGAKVPVSESNPAGTAAGNRGVQFGEQVAAGTANRPAYALAENTDDLDARVALWEASGLDAAYDLGAAAVPGGGRVITKDDGAIETRSANAAMYDEDIANAHFRADLSGDGVNGGVGLDVVGYGRSGTGNHLASVLDRRAITPSNYSILSATVAVTLNIGGADPDGLTIGAGQLRDGSSNTDLILGYDLVEVLSGPHAGVYVILNLVSGVACTLLNLDGTSPAFTSSTVSTARFFRPTMSASSRYGSSGTHLHRSMVLSGVPGQESALDLIGGAAAGRRATSGASPDGTRMAARVLRRPVGGAPEVALEVDALGSVKSVVTTTGMTTVEKGYSKDFGNPAFLAQQDVVAAAAEIGFAARSSGVMANYYGHLSAVDKITDGVPTGTAAFTFKASNILDFGALDVGIEHAIPGVTLIEIVTPVGQAGVYAVASLSSGDTEIGVASLVGAALTLPTSGAGTARLLGTAGFGRRTIIAPDGTLFSALGGQGRATAVIDTPGEDYSTALLLGASLPANQHFLRGFAVEDGTVTETVRLAADGTLGVKSVIADGTIQITGTTEDFEYEVARTKYIPINIMAGINVTSGGWNIAALGAPHIRVSNGSATVRLIFDLNPYLRTGQQILGVRFIGKPGSDPGAAQRMRVAVYRVGTDFTSPYSAAATPVLIAGAELVGTAITGVTAAPVGTHIAVRGFETENGGNDYYAEVISTDDTVNDELHGLELIIGDRLIRNN